MEFIKDNGAATYRIKAYTPSGSSDAGSITTNDSAQDQHYHCPILIMPEKLIVPWHVASFTELRREDFEMLLPFHPQVVLIGKENLLATAFLSPDIIQPLTERGIGVEVMSSASACRTYTILMAEERNVAAMIFV